jgi:hypothetical protein
VALAQLPGVASAGTESGDCSSAIAAPAGLELARVLLKPALRVASSDAGVRARLSALHLSDVLAHIFLSDRRPEARAAAAHLLADLEPAILDDTSPAFSAAFAGEPQLERDLEREQRRERHQLEEQPFVFARVRGYPSATWPEEERPQQHLERVLLREWAAVALKSSAASLALRRKHACLYYEVELLELGAPARLGWARAGAFRPGILRIPEAPDASTRHVVSLGGSGSSGDGNVGGAHQEDDDETSWALRLSPPAFKASAVLGCAADLDAGRLTWTLDGRVVQEHLLLPGLLASNNKDDAALLVPGLAGSSIDAVFNFGSRPFTFAPPAGNYRSVLRSVEER